MHWCRAGVTSHERKARGEGRAEAACYRSNGRGARPALTVAACGFAVKAGGALRARRDTASCMRTMLARLVQTVGVRSHVVGDGPAGRKSVCSREGAPCVRLRGARHVHADRAQAAQGQCVHGTDCASFARPRPAWPVCTGCAMGMNCMLSARPRFARPGCTGCAMAWTARGARVKRAPRPDNRHKTGRPSGPRPRPARKTR